MKKYIVIMTAILSLTPLVFLYRCAPSEPQPIKAGLVPDNEYDPAEWGKVYPLEYESWLKTKEPKPVGMSKYRRGWDDDKIIYDRLSEFPYSTLLYNGWGFGIEYNEPRGHSYAVKDQIDVDPSRVAAGGVCLACKSPYHKSFTEKKGMDYLKAKFMDAVNMIPEKHRELGPACIDCHKNDTMDNRINKLHIEKGLKMIGKEDFTRQERRMLACAQCHVTYYVPRDKNKKVDGDVLLPWTGSKWGGISIENIIKDLLTDYKREEWTQKVTGFSMPYIRHPEFEMFSRNSVHWRAGLACADCHMPYTRVGSYKISDHNVTSPLKAEMRACSQCHTEAATWLKDEVIAIQDRTASLLNRAGYLEASSAKLFELIHGKRNAGVAFDNTLYEKAKGFYKQAFLRIVFVGAENSTGFHNPTEAGRILGDAIAFASKTESLLRQILAKAGVDIPEILSLELKKYADGRGKKKLNFKRSQELKDPFDTQKYFTSEKSRGL